MLFFSAPKHQLTVPSYLSFHCNTGSDSDDEAVSGYHEPLLEAKDPYALRPMPYLIGTGGFFSAEDVGIGELPTDSEGMWGVVCDSACVRACVRVCVRACVCACVCVDCVVICLFTTLSNCVYFAYMCV